MEASQCIVCRAPLPQRIPGRSGPRSPCCSNECRRLRENEMTRRTRAADRDKARAIQRAWYARNPGKVQARRERKADWNKVYQRKYYLDNTERAKVKQVKRRLNGKQRETWRRWVAIHATQERERCREKSLRRRAVIHGVFAENVIPSVVFDRSGGVCGVCAVLITSDEKWHVDHIVPLSKGGAHSYANTQPAHAFCNISKGSKWPFQRAG